MVRQGSLTGTLSDLPHGPAVLVDQGEEIAEHAVSVTHPAHRAYARWMQGALESGQRAAAGVIARIPSLHLVSSRRRLAEISAFQEGGFWLAYERLAS